MPRVLVLIGGLPGVGKTTVARELAGRIGAAHVRIDALEAGLVTTGLVAAGADVGPAGYELALAVADTCLAAGGAVVADAVFPVAVSRAPWTALARRYGVPNHWFRLVHGDAAEHRRRVDERVADLPGGVVPDWAAVESRETDEWTEPHTVVDTAEEDPVGAIEDVLATPAAVVRWHVEAVDARDVDRVLAGLTDDVRWHTSGGRADGVAELGELLTEVFALTTARLEIRRLVSGADGTVAAELRSTTYVEGLPVSGLLSAWYRVRDGRIAEARIYREDSVS
jgi:predicted kinase/ketosteroid isomerase-like protein